MRPYPDERWRDTYDDWKLATPPEYESLGPDEDDEEAFLREQEPEDEHYPQLEESEGPEFLSGEKKIGRAQEFSKDDFT